VSKQFSFGDSSTAVPLKSFDFRVYGSLKQPQQEINFHLHHPHSPFS